MNSPTTPVAASQPTAKRTFPHLGIPIPARGTRGDIPPQPGKRLVVCLGCSHTFGQTGARHTWPAYLQRLLPTHEFQVLNMGRRNYGLRLNVDWFHEFAASLRPEMCILQVPLFCRQPLPGVQEDVPANYTMKNGSLSLLRAGRISFAAYYERCPDLIERDVTRLAAFLVYLKKAGVAPVIVLYKTNLAGEDFLWDFIVRHHEKIQQLCAAAGVPCCAGDQLTNHFLGRCGMLRNDTHANERGNLFIARLVYDAVFCPPLRPPGTAAWALIQAQAALGTWAGRCAKFFNPIFNKTKKAAPKGGALDQDLPGEIYTLW